MTDNKANKYKKMIEDLNVSEQIKEFLRRVEEVASSGNSKLKASVADIFIKSPSCSELSKLARTYENIITGYGVYPFRGVGTYLELAFPSRGTDRDYKDFYASPRRVAATSNHFSGVFLISFEQWGSADEVIRDESFDSLVKFIEANRRRISFVFHITPDFRDGKILYDELSKYANLEYLEHFFPDKAEAAEYIKNQIREAEIELSQAGIAEIDRLIDERLDVTAKSYNGYRTLEKISKRLLFELYSRQGQKSERMGEESRIEVDAKDVAEMSSLIDMHQDSDHRRKIGFT